MKIGAVSPRPDFERLRASFTWGLLNLLFEGKKDES
jgi:hypothetical protein